MTSNVALGRRGIFIVSEFVDGRSNSTGYYWHKIITGLAKNGVKTNVISTKASCELAEVTCSCVNYIPVNESSGYKKNSLIKRALGQLRLSLLFLRAIAANIEKRDLVFSGTNPSFLLLFVATLKPILGFKWVLLVHDVFPENLIPAGIVTKNSISYRILKIIFDRAYRRADVLIAIGRDMRELLHSKTGGCNELKYLPNWVDVSEVDGQGNLSANFFGRDIDRAIVFQFFGNIGRVQGIDVLLAAIKMVRNKNAAFLFIGGGAAESSVKEFIDLNPDLKIAYSPGLPFDRNSEGLFACDVGIISLAPGMSGLGVPSKAYFSMAANKKILVIGDMGSELQLTLQENPEVGWFSRAGNPEEIALTIDQICEAFVRNDTNAPKTLVSEKFSYEKAIDNLLTILGEIRNSAIT